MGFLVEKPQFDTVKLQPGAPIQIKHNRGTAPDGWHNANHACLVLDVTPLELTVVRIRRTTSFPSTSQTYERETLTINIEKVADNTLTITKLITEIEPEKEGKLI